MVPWLPVADSRAVTTVGDVVLDNDRVVVRRVVAEPGDTFGVEPGDDGLLWTFVRGGVLVDSTGGRTHWHDGRVWWWDAAAARTEFGNIGDTQVHLVTVALKSSDRESVAGITEPLRYPNIVGEDLLVNDMVIVQRFVVAPGQWEGVHAHPPNMMYVHIHGGHWAARSYSSPPTPYPQPSDDGEVGWMDPVDLTVGHESGNVGTTPIDFIWVSLRT